MQPLTCPKCNTEDDYIITQRNIHKTAYCNKCGSYIKNIPQGNPIEMPFGKYKGTMLSDLTSDEHVRYLNWILTQSFTKGSLRQKITDHLNSL